MSNDVEIELLRVLSSLKDRRPQIEGALARAQLFSQPHFRMSSRVKSLGRAFDKLSRLRVDSPEANPCDIYDLLGFRIVTLFNASVIESLDILLDASEHRGEFHGSSPFVKQRPKLFLYTARPESDPLSLKKMVDDWTSRNGLVIEQEYVPRATPTLYSSVHFVAACQVQVEDVHQGTVTINLPVEIQLRTAMEDVWGQISHLTSYSHADGKPSINRHLNALKQLLDGCSLYAENIRGESVISVKAGNEALEGPRPHDSTLGNLHSLPKEISQAFEAALRLRAAAVQTEQNSGDMFDDAASRFGAIERMLLKDPDIGSGVRKEAIYLSQLERAFCLMYSEKISSKDEALALYNALAKANKDDALCHLRLGQALRRKDLLARARDAFLEAINILAEDRDRRAQDRDSLTHAVFVELGFVYWTIGQRETDPEKREEAMRDAVKASKEAMNYGENLKVEPAERLGGINNLLYYAWEYWHVFHAPVLSEREVSDFVEELSPEAITALLPLYKQDAVLDTLLRNLIYLKRHRKAREIAHQIIDLIRKKAQRRSNTTEAPDRALLQKNLTEDELDTYWHALETLTNSTPDEAHADEDSAE